MIFLILDILILFIIAYMSSTNLFTKDENTKLIEFKIKNSIFEYKKSTKENPTYYDYDYYLLRHNYELKEIYSFVNNRPESDFYKLTKFIYEDDDTYVSSNDDEIINSLKFLMITDNQKQEDIIYSKYINNYKKNKNIYINDLFKNKEKTKMIYKRILQIKETNEYKRIYKSFFIEIFNGNIKIN